MQPGWDGIFPFCPQLDYLYLLNTEADVAYLFTVLTPSLSSNPVPAPRLKEITIIEGNLELDAIQNMILCIEERRQSSQDSGAKRTDKGLSLIVDIVDRDQWDVEEPDADEYEDIPTDLLGRLLKLESQGLSLMFDQWYGFS